MSTLSRSPQTASSGLFTARQWIALVIAIGVVIQALLAGQGFYESRPALTTGHGHLGNTLFLLSIAQVVVAWLLFQRRDIGRLSLVLTGSIVLSVFAQVGLGYAGRSEASAMAWHLPNGVLLMGLTAAYTAIAFAPRTAQDG